MSGWFISEDFKDQWHRFFLEAHATMLALPMRGKPEDWDPPKLPLGLESTIPSLIILHKAFYHLLLKYSYSMSADKLATESKNERDYLFWRNERLYHFHDFFIRYRSFLDYSARFVAPFFSWRVVSPENREEDKVYFEPVLNDIKKLIDEKRFDELEFLSEQEVILLQTFLDKIDVRNACQGKQKEIVQTIISNTRNETTHRQLLSMDGDLWSFVRHYPPKPPKQGRDKRVEVERITFGETSIVFSDYTALALKTLTAIAEAFDILNNVEFFRVRLQ